MTCYLRRALIVTSALLCLATLLLWGRSYFAHDMVEAHRRGEARGRAYDDIRGVISERGAIGAGYVRIGHPGVAGFADTWMHTADAPPNPWPLRFNFLVFSYFNTALPASAKHGPAHAVGFTVPHALIVVLLALWPAHASHRYWRGRRAVRVIATDQDVASHAKLRARAAGRCPERSGAPQSWPVAATIGG
jgi:hypothetical protein